VEVGAGAAAGVITTSQSTTTTISIATRISTEATGSAAATDLPNYPLAVQEVLAESEVQEELVA